MPTNVTFNGSSYSIPANREPRGWGASLSNFLVDVANSSLAKSGGAFTLTADANFGANFGLVSKYIKSVSSNIAQSGIIRLANTDKVAFRNNANGADLSLGVSTSDRLQFESVNIPTISSTDTLTNKTLTSPVISSPTGLVKGDVGLGNVDNTSDANKPVSTAQQTALNLKANLASPTFTGTVTLPSGQALIAPALGTVASGVITACTGSPTLTTVTGTTSVITPLLKAYDGNGIKFQENGGTEIGSATDAGAWTFGPSNTDTASGPGHVLNGYTVSGATGLGDAQKRFMWTANAYNASYSGVTRNSNGGTLGGVMLEMFARTSNSSNVLTLSANQIADGNTTAPTPLLIVTQAGSVTIGPPAAIGGSSYPGNKIIGKTDASSISAGYVGEKITWSTPPTTANLGTSTADWTNATFTLTPGVWQIFANICVSAVTGTTAANSTYAQVYITDGSNNIVQNQEKRLLVLTPAAASSQVVTALPFALIVNISSSTTYKIRALRVDAAGTGSAQIRNAGADYSEFYAVRIA
jgi:hypothetical protein